MSDEIRETQEVGTSGRWKKKKTGRANKLQMKKEG